MRVAMVNPFDPPPGDLVREGRYAAFGRALARAGHDVTWYSSDWSHALKRRRDGPAVATACRAAEIRVELLPTPPYHKNVGLARLRSHAALAQAMPQRLDTADPRPDAVLVSLPPPNLAAAVAQWAHARGVPCVLDIQDLWPETFVRLWPRGLRWLNAVAGALMRRDVRRAYALADGCIAVAAAYADHFRAAVGPDKPCDVLHLGVDLQEFDRSVGPLSSVEPVLPGIAGRRWVFVGGSLGTALNWKFMLELADSLLRRRGNIQMMVVGTGPMEAWLRRQVAARKLSNVHLLGQQPYHVFCTLAAASDFGLNHYRADSCVYFPNRVFDFFAAGLPVLNTMGGELADLLAARGAGFTTTDFNVDETVRHIEAHAADKPPPSERPLPRDRRAAWVNAFDRPAIAARLVDVLGRLVHGTSQGAAS